MKEKDLAVKKDKPGISRRQPGTKGGKNPCRCYSGHRLQSSFGDSAVHPVAILKIP
jgi:hypothetical protein